MSEIQKTIIERIKEALNIQEEVSIFDLYDLLYKTRNISHPDLFDEKFKKEATEKFSTFNILLEELKLYIDNQKLKKVGTDLIMYKENYENILDKSQILFLESKISTLENQLKEKSEKIEILKVQIKNLNDVELNRLENEIKELYRPKKNSIWVLGITATLILLINVLVQITKLKDNFINLFPFEIELINIFLFVLFVFLVVKILLNNYHLNKIKKISEELKTNDKIQQFLNGYVDYRKREYYDDYTKDIFTENQVEKYIKDNFFNRFELKSKFFDNILDRFLYPNKAKNINYLKDIFIYNLITRNLIRIGNSKLLDREFQIK